MSYSVLHLVCCLPDRACSAGKFAAVRELVEHGHASLDIKDRQVSHPMSYRT